MSQQITPTADSLTNANIAQFMRLVGKSNFAALHAWSVEPKGEFWHAVMQTLSIKFDVPYQQICDAKLNVEKPNWLLGAKLNITTSCFQAESNALAIVSQAEDGVLVKMTYGELEALVNRISNSLQKLGLKKGSAIAIDMPMTAQAVAIYLAIIRVGCSVVSIADSFAPNEIESRLRIANTQLIFTQDYLLRAGKQLPLYDKVIEAQACPAIVAPGTANETPLLKREGDMAWDDFLQENTVFSPVVCDPYDVINILFSSGTTGDPKAIPWLQMTPIKCASDAYFHCDVKPQDILAWPTNLGWMMGPWLVFAALLNRATIAIFEGAPLHRQFGEFVQNAGVNILGIVPSIVNHWRASHNMEDLDWRAIKLFASSGECSNPEDMWYLMQLAGGKPIIEYCGGTEVAGAYISSTIVQTNRPSEFTTPVLGIDFCIIDDNGEEVDNGEVALIPPSIGLSESLLNRDHHDVYYAGMPVSKNRGVLRRHGDQIERIAEGRYRALGRVDDTMNLGGIKTSSAEIERVLNTHAMIQETAAIAVPPVGGGPDRLIIYAVIRDNAAINEQLKTELQSLIKTQLNPLFKIHDLLSIASLPRTASNKVMRRVLRKEYEKLA